jgi:hypothetical protein
MQSLKTKSLLKTMSHITDLKQLLLHLKDDSVAMSVATSDATFWPPMLRQCLFEDDVEELILTRGDLETGDDWFVFCQDLVRGNAYAYAWFQYADQKDEIGPRFSINTTHGMDDASDCTIMGTLPRPGIITICVDVWQIGNGISHKTAIFHTNLTLCLSNVIRWALEKIRYHSDKNTFFYEDLGDEVVLSTERFEESYTTVLEHILEYHPNNDGQRTIELQYFPFRVRPTDEIVSKILYISFSRVMSFPEY